MAYFLECLGIFCGWLILIRGNTGGIYSQTTCIFPCRAPGGASDLQLVHIPFRAQTFRQMKSKDQIFQFLSLIAFKAQISAHKLLFKIDSEAVQSNMRALVARA